MKKFVLFSFFILLFSSCSAVKVYSDYDKKVDFTPIKTFAFYKAGIDKVEISDLDKRRILNSIEEVLTSKGFTKSETPDVLINFFTKEREQTDVNQFNMGWGYGWGWDPWMWGGNTSINTYVEGTLFIDLIDAKKKELIWQGEGIGALTKNREKKEELIKEFVIKILSQYPPEK